MKVFQLFAACLGVSLFCTAAAQPASPIAQRQSEVAHLLEFVEQSKCQFNRNGSWHESREARVHLQKKYDYLERRGRVPTAESFIERGASQSSMSGEVYKVRCGDGKVIKSADWLSEELSRLRDAKKQAMPTTQR